jgi:hypothetical protein
MAGIMMMLIDTWYLIMIGLTKVNVNNSICSTLIDLNHNHFEGPYEFQLVLLQ